MKRNVGGLDQRARLVLGVVLLTLGVLALWTAAMKLVVVVIGLVGLGTGLIRFCPINALLAINTCKE